MPVQNGFKTSTMLVNESIIGFEDFSEFLGVSNNDYEGMVADYKGMPTGGQIQVRMRDNPTIAHGRTASAIPLIQQFESIVVDEDQRLNQMFEMTSDDLAVKRLPVTDTTAYQTAQAMAQVCDQDIAKHLKLNTSMFVGSSNSADFNYAQLDSISSRMDELGVPSKNRTMVTNSADYETLSVSIHNKNLFDEPLNKSINREIFVGRYGKFDIAKSNILIGINHTAGTAAGDSGMSLTTPTASADYKSGTITIGGVGTGKTLKAGDRITVTGVYLINPLTKTKTRQPLQFVVQEDVNESGGSFTDVQVKPGMVPVTTANGGWFANLESLPADGTAITIEGDHRLNFAISKAGLTFTSIMLKDLSTIADVFGAKAEVEKQKSNRSEKTKLAMRLGFDSDIKEDLAMWRLDLQPVYHAFIRYNFAFITAV